MFGIGYVSVAPFGHSMDPETYLTEIDVDLDRAVDFLDARDLPPPEPLQQTVNRLADLDDRGIDYEITEIDEGVVTAMWRPSS